MATMNNEKLILAARFELMDAGILNGSGIHAKLEDGTDIELPEEIHTYNVWKQMGFQVQRGQKSIATIRIWQFGKSKKDDAMIREATNGQKTEADGHFFQKNAFFFKASQVAPIAANA